MKVTTKVCLRARNIGKPTESLTIEDKPWPEAMKLAAHWMAKLDLGSRIDIMVGRDLDSIRFIDGQPSQRHSQTIESLDELFDPNQFGD